MRRVEPAGHADYDALTVGNLKSLRQALHLDVEGFVAIAVQSRRLVGYERKTVDAALETDVCKRRLVGESNAAKCFFRMARCNGGAIEGQRAHALKRKPFNIDIRDSHLTFGGEALGLRKQSTKLVYGCLPVPGKVGGAFSRAGGRVNVRAQAAHGLGRA